MRAQTPSYCHHFRGDYTDLHSFSLHLYLIVSMITTCLKPNMYRNIKPPLQSNDLHYGEMLFCLQKEGEYPQGDANRFTVYPPTWLIQVHTHSFALCHVPLCLTGSLSVSQYLVDSSCSPLYSLVFHLYFHLSSSPSNPVHALIFTYSLLCISLSLAVTLKLSKVLSFSFFGEMVTFLFLSSELTDTATLN